MDESNQRIPSEPITTKLFEYEFEIEELRFQFSRPQEPQLERYFATMSKNFLRANKILARELINPAQRDGWEALCAKKPGASQQAATAILKELGFLEEASKIELGN